MENYCIYLRKSRADAEAEARGEGETLARHRNMLTELARRQNLNVVRIFEEIVSGESISARPQMQELLAEVSRGRFAGVLVAEIERLARGDTIDQGIVARTFRQSSTKIVTPAKTYDPENEFDEEYFEFSLFMSRREYKTINRRMQAGRLASVKEGNYIGTYAPYGYRKISPEPKVHTLDVVPEEAETVRLIYQLFLKGRGAKYIAGELNRLGISPRKSPFWEYTSVRKILSNPIYCGKVSWKTKSGSDTLFQGRHTPIISEETFAAANSRRSSASAPRLHSGEILRNYYHGVLFCKSCGHLMKRRIVTGSNREYLLCTNSQCRGIVVSSAMEAVDTAVLSALRYRLGKFPMLRAYGVSEKPELVDTKSLLKAELEKVNRQLSRLHDLLEQDIYGVQEFVERSEILKQRIGSLEKAMSESEVKERIPSPGMSLSVELSSVLARFPDALPDVKNRLFIAVFREISYSKNKPHTHVFLNADMR